jgi:hypothetical protein
MPIDLSAFLAEAESEKERFRQIIRGLEDRSDDHMTPEQSQQILTFIEAYKGRSAFVEQIVAGLEGLMATSYPKDLVLYVSSEFRKHIDEEEAAEKAADALIVAAPSAVDGPLLFHAPIVKP